MQIDCFITSKAPRTKERGYFLSLTQLALHANGFNAIIIEKPMLERYLECERLATSDIYLLSDDDIIPGTPSTLKNLVTLMEKHPEISQLGLSLRKDLRREEMGEWIKGDIGEDIWEVDHVGGIMAIRRGTIKDNGERPSYPYGDGDDRIMGRVAREGGYKVGIANKLWFHHLGAGFSTLI